MEHSDAWTHDFLLLHYNEIDFLVDRNQFSASMSLEEIHPVKGGTRYWKSWSRYNEEKLLLFDMNQYLKDLYHCTQQGENCLCLIIRLEDFHKEGQQKLLKILGSCTELSRNYLGLIVTSLAEIHPLHLEEFFLSPPGLRELLNRRGLYGCRFPEEDRIQFLVDLQKYLFYSLEPLGQQPSRKRRLHASTAG